MAGVPSIMQAMLNEVAPKLKIGVRMLSETARADAREGGIGMQLGETKAGSGAIRSSRSTARAQRERVRDAQKLAQAKRAVEEMLERVRRAQSKQRVNLALSRRKQGRPLGSANDFSELRQFRLCRFAASPTFLHWTVLHTVPIERNLRRDI